MVFLFAASSLFLRNLFSVRLSPFPIALVENVNLDNLFLKEDYFC